MKRMVSLILLLLIGLLTQCTKEPPYGVYCAECKAYKKVPTTDPQTNLKYIELEEVHSKSWCDSRPVVIEGFFNSYTDSFDVLMENSNSGDEYCVKCESLTYLQEKLEYSNCD